MIVIAIAIVAVLCGMQLYFYLRTRAAALRLNDLFPVESPAANIVTTGSAEQEAAATGKPAPRLVTASPQSAGFQTMLQGINTYLEKNRGMPVTFVVLQDIVERTADSYAQGASTSVTLPLYLGLMGTFAGAILGLGAMASGQTSGMGDTDLDQFLGGVLVAMVGSLFGLILYVAGRRHVARAEGAANFRKRDFFILLQSELLPAAGEDVSTALYSLQANLSRFNQELSANLAALNTAMEAPGETLKQQRELLQALDRTDLKRLIEANGSMLHAVMTAAPVLKDFIDETQKFVGDLKAVHEVSNRIAALLDRVSTFEASLNGVAARLREEDFASSSVLRLVAAQMDALESRKEMIRQFLDVQDNTIQRSLRAQTIEVDSLFSAAKQELATAGQQLSHSLLNVVTRERADELMGNVALLQEHGTLMKQHSALLAELGQRSAAQQQLLSTLVEQQGRTTRSEELLSQIADLLHKQAERRSIFTEWFRKKEKGRQHAGTGR